MTTPDLHVTTAEIYENSPKETRPRSHADLIRSFDAGLAELTADGVLTTTGVGHWKANGVTVVRTGTYTDAQGRTQACYLFGSWLCLAMALKVSNKETRKALMLALKRNPIY
jgi:hypothetical protein